MLLENVLRVQPSTKESALPGSYNSALRADAEPDLVEGCKDGSLPAYERLYLSHGPRMKSIALNLLGNTSDAEDAVQEAFLKIYRSVAEFRGKSAFTTWIYRILVNTCHDMRRSSHFKQEMRRLDPDTQEPGEALMQTVDHPMRLALEKCLDDLSPRNRTVFLLFEVEGFKHSEIAEIMGIPEGTSKNSLFDAKRELRRMLKDSPRPLRSTL
ncbi:MAG: RNA polymerase sigma factor [Acidobacteriia bacterium]|nr:RNA polymerase sigma factor [Terriglobia bacterium]